MVQQLPIPLQASFPSEKGALLTDIPRTYVLGMSSVEII